MFRTGLWVTVLSIPAGSSTIHVYYGNTAATYRNDEDMTA
ncbi:MAG: DUF2341 domain-containing protein [Bacteroidetes bacterium]|nr:DUF2341 domain-containing protein [Bacteroidota bacterium]